MVPLLERATGLFKGRLNCHGPLGTGRYSAAIEGRASETIAKILAGHKIGGMSRAYRFFRPINCAEA